MCSIFVSLWEVFYDCGGVYCCEVSVYVLFCNDVRVCNDVCCVCSFAECGLFLKSEGPDYVIKLRPDPGYVVKLPPTMGMS